jgi:arabinose-5-phosphate isomerase
MNVIHHARRVIGMEVEALQAMARRLGKDFAQAVDTIANNRGRVIVIGMGKSGHIGRKIAATMASTGTPAFFVHPGEAFHGDLGMIQPPDVLLLISNSGETEELIRLLPFLKQQGNALVAMTGRRESTLGRAADVVLDIGVESEACSNNLAPTSSTTATLVMGDALAVTLSQLKGFRPEDFARFHPGGSLGRRLLTRVQDVMQREGLPFCREESSFRDVIHAITRGRLGLVLVGSHRHLHGVITDGDIRRSFDAHPSPLSLHARDIMSARPITIGAEALLSEAEALMQARRVGAVIVLGPRGEVAGVAQLLDTAVKTGPALPGDATPGPAAPAAEIGRTALTRAPGSATAATPEPIASACSS